MVAAMDLRVAILAATADHARVGSTALKRCCRCLIRAEELARVQRRRVVALLAEIRARGGEQLVVVGSVRLVTIGTALTHRRVFPKHRAAFFSVARVTNFVDAVGLEQRRG